MIAWAIVWLLLACLTALFAAMELINGSLEWRFWFCVIFVLILIMIPAFTIQEYRQSLIFYDNYTAFYDRVSNQDLTPDQEYMILGEAMNYNHYLYIYQSRFKTWGVFAPTYVKIKDLKPVELNNFDMNNYKWWE